MEGQEQGAFHGNRHVFEMMTVMTKTLMMIRVQIVVLLLLLLRLQREKIRPIVSNPLLTNKKASQIKCRPT